MNILCIGGLDLADLDNYTANSHSTTTQIWHGKNGSHGTIVSHGSMPGLDGGSTIVVTKLKTKTRNHSRKSLVIYIIPR